MPSTSSKNTKAPKNLKQQRLIARCPQQIKFIKVGDEIVHKKPMGPKQSRAAAFDKYHQRQLKEYKEYQAECDDIIQTNMKKIQDAST